MNHPIMRKSTRSPSLSLLALSLVLLAFGLSVAHYRASSCPCCGEKSSGERDPPGNAWKAHHRLAIAYLCRKTHSSYGHDSMSNLERSLELLHQNVLTGPTQADVLVMHEGEQSLVHAGAADDTGGRQCNFQDLF